MPGEFEDAYFENIRHGISELLNELNALIRSGELGGETEIRVRSFRDLLSEYHRAIVIVEITDRGDEYSDAIASIRDATVATNEAREDVEGVIDAIDSISEAISRVSKVLSMI